MTILDLCSGSGGWSEPYRKNGYYIISIDLSNGDDVRLLEHPGEVHGILAAPPCTVFSGSGARWWKGRKSTELIEALSVVDACLRLVAITRPAWWALENPVGRLRKWLGEPRLIFNPCDYGDPWTKRTCLWGDFRIPLRSPVEPFEGSKMHLLSPSDDRTALRSITPLGFAEAFYGVNP